MSSSKCSIQAVKLMDSTLLLRIFMQPHAIPIKLCDHFIYVLAIRGKKARV